MFRFFPEETTPKENKPPLKIVTKISLHFLFWLPLLVRPSSIYTGYTLFWPASS